MAENRVTVPLDTSWFDADPEKYLARPDFIRFQEAAGVDFRDLLSHDPSIVKSAQSKIVSLSVIMNEIQSLHFGFGFPFLVYTQSIMFFNKTDKH